MLKEDAEFLIENTVLIIENLNAPTMNKCENQSFASKDIISCATTSNSEKN